MRLNRFDPSSINVRGGGGGGFPGGAGGGIGCGTLVIALVAALVFGVDPTSMLTGSGTGTGVPATQGELPPPLALMLKSATGAVREMALSQSVPALSAPGKRV